MMTLTDLKQAVRELFLLGEEDDYVPQSGTKGGRSRRRRQSEEIMIDSSEEVAEALKRLQDAAKA